MEKPRKSGISRRELLVSTAAGAAVGGWLYVRHNEGGENRESLEHGSDFEKELSGYGAQIGLSHNEIIFVDEHNVPIGSPIDFSDAIGAEYKDGEICISPPPKYWRDEQIALLEAAYPGRTVAQSHNVALVFEAALTYVEEPALQAGLRDGTIATFSDIVNYFANLPTRNRDKSLYLEDGKEVSREKYVYEHLVFDVSVPEVIQSPLRRLMLGLCAQESKFNNGLVSKADAEGIFQFMPDTWNYYATNGEIISSLRDQVAIAGKLLSDIYREVMHHCNVEALARAKQSFATTDEFLTQFVLPLMVNSYNAGSARIGSAVNAFFTENYQPEKYQGLDVFLAMADAAEASNDEKLKLYGEHAREYVPRVYAHAIAIHERQT